MKITKSCCTNQDRLRISAFEHHAEN